MGCADVVPGVSGGTIAFITGIYERFIEALRSISPAFVLLLMRGRVRESARAFARMHWSTLGPVLFGIGLAVILMAKFITAMMDSRPGETYAFFFGLILASCWAPFAAMKSRRITHVLPAVLTGVLAFWVVGLQTGEPPFRVAKEAADGRSAILLAEVRDINDVVAARRLAPAEGQLAVIDPRGVSAKRGGEALNGVAGTASVVVLPSEAAAKEWLSAHEGAMLIERDRASLPWIFVCGMIAISAMMLPGISGSFLLLFLGQYKSVMGAISGVMDTLATLGGAGEIVQTRAWWSDFVFLGVFGCGVIVGMATFSRAVSWLFRHAHDATMAGLAGFMIGALRQPGEAVWRANAERGHDGSAWRSALLAAVIGVAIVVVVSVADHVARARRARNASA